MAVIDLAVYNKVHELVLTVEVKKRAGVSAEWATQYYRNILSHGTYPRSPFFLLTTLDTFFLWKRNGDDVNGPSYIVNSRDYLEQFFNEFGTTAEEVSPYMFEQIVARWLKTLIYPIYADQNTLPEWLQDSGLASAVYNGDFYLEKVA
jgi:uncharacterized membrane protein